ncbi:host attachment protein [Caballeronia sp. BCC1704]|uniref:host attachment protein n=1 Tax=Caballeronia sp. BCC1704 TaxID=2676300 RepID=UPI003263F33A
MARASLEAGRTGGSIMTAITWVLAADEHRARIFETRGLKVDLQQVEDIRNTARSRNEASDKDRETFARSIASYLDHARQQHRFNRLRLAVDARFLGVLQACLSSETRMLVYDDNGKSALSEQRYVERR